jgi:Ran GTPase-activating protein (RanGAP) involved in mRNA processing and transport
MLLSMATKLGYAGIITLAGAIPDMEALTKLDLSFNGLGPEGGKALAVGLKGNRVITELNIAINYLGYAVSTGESDTSGAVAIAAAIRDMKALSSVNLLQNDIGNDKAKVLASILKEHPALKSLCGNTGNETELDMSGKEMGAEGVIMLAAEIAGNGALTSLDISNQVDHHVKSSRPPIGIGAEEAKHLAGALKDHA